MDEDEEDGDVVHSDDDAVFVRNAKGENEEIDVPEALTVELDSMLYDYSTRNYLSIDSTCNLPNYNPAFEEEVYIKRLSQLPTVMEMAYNDVVRKFIDRYSGQLRRSVSLMLGAQNFYMPIFEEALESYNLPLELKYLPVIESALNPKAVSHAGATGLWQFMIGTGKQYGLEVNSLVDERRDPILSSYAAAHYLSDLYRIFGDWNLVIAAYNCGPENINKAIHRANGARDYWQIYPYLPRETRGYVPAFIAANYIMNYYCEHNICPLMTRLPEKSDTVMVDRNVHFEQIAHVLNLDIEQIKNLNPQYRRDIVNGLTKPSAIRLPANMVNLFIDNQDSIFAYKADVLLTKRAVVAVNDDVPMYKKPVVRKSTKSRRGKTVRSSKSRRGKNVRATSSRSRVKGRATSTARKKASTTRKKTTTARKKTTTARKKTTTARKRTNTAAKKKAPARKSTAKRRR
ncbi:MAG: transglycosylase SLT domain-containing protein [Prevotella sp.]|nr:transglycosylase SLT domain-containing protein [Prevotella sp.]